MSVEAFVREHHYKLRMDLLSKAVRYDPNHPLLVSPIPDPETFWKEAGPDCPPINLVRINGATVIPVSEIVAPSDPAYRDRNLELVCASQPDGLLKGRIHLYRKAVIIRQYSPEEIAANPSLITQEDRFMRGCYYASKVWGKYVNSDHSPPPNTPLESFDYSVCGMINILGTWVEERFGHSGSYAETAWNRFDKSTCSLQ